ncbi:hypothetical protein RRG08_060450 [Elysia crispata]|uniref:Macrophage mannose receptor 1-like n=1 Tax=Elysia crispata TaxID=231223 RepID=A0AAE1B0J5_9GAST|nr:hypothetical protein RRG08_060450 [Elysia crispata]
MESANTTIMKSKSVILLGLVSLLLAGHVQSQCEAPWEGRPGGDSCYLYIDKQGLHWEDAAMFCRNNGGFLVAVNSRDEESYLAGRLATSKMESFWIGANDIDTEFGWVWLDGSPFSYFNWAPGQPDNYVDQDFVYLNKTTMQWADVGPSAVLGIICEMKVEVNTTAKRDTIPQPQAGKFYGCEDGWVSYQDRCYLIQGDKKSWFDAQVACRQMKADLVSISSEWENQFIWSQVPYGCQDRNSSCPELAQNGGCPANATYTTVNCRKSCGLCDGACANAYETASCDYWAFIGECTKNPFWMWPNCGLSCGCDPSTNEGYWIGFNDRSSPMNFVWSDLSPVTYAYWMRQEPSSFQKGKEDCVLMHSVTGEWSDEVCATPSSGYVCEKPKDFMDQRTVDASAMGCSFGSMGYKGKCFTTVATAKSWSDAKAYCERLKGQLAILPDKRSNAFLTSVLFAEEENSNVWVGLSATGEAYSWVDGSSPHFAAWTANHTGKERDMCTSLTRKGWDPLSCDTVSPFVCETSRRGWAAPATTTVTVASSKTNNITCPSGWSDFKQLCYKFTSTPKRWLEAQTFCESQAASLMTLHNQDTNDFLFETLLQNKDILDNNEIWFGLRETSFGDRREYVWIDGTPLDFQAWDDGQPNSFTVIESCGAAQTASQSWKISSCFERKAFVCQLKKGGLYITLATEKEMSPVPTTPSPYDIPLCRERTTTGDDTGEREAGGFDPDTLGSGSSKESNAKTAPSTAKKPQCHGMSLGTIAGIVVSAVCGCAVLVSGAFLVGKRRGSSWQQAGHQNEAAHSDCTGFDNALYMAKQRDSESDNTKISMDELRNA